MKNKIDLHTHTISSGHAYSTLEENIRAAKRVGLEIYGVSDHYCKLPGAPHEFYFENMKVIPNTIDGVRILKGIEANIINYDGELDVLPSALRYCDYLIASLHPPTIPCGILEDNTKAIIGAMKNERVKIIGHPDDDRFPLDYELVVRMAKETNTLLEVNNSSLDKNSTRKNGKENIKTYLQFCKSMDVKVIIGSDAHISFDVGRCDNVLSVLDEVEFPNELIINNNPEELLLFLGIK